MTEQQIYDVLDPTWWVTSDNGWDTEFVSTVINYNTKNLTGAIYTSSAPIQTNGLNSGTSAPNTQLSNTIDHLRQSAAEQLFRNGCIAVTGHQELGSVFNAAD